MVEHEVTNDAAALELREAVNAVVRLPGAAAIAVPLALAALELLHPTFPDGSPSVAVAALGSGWIELHLALIVGYGLLVWTLWPRGSAGRAVFGLFLACNTAFLGVDGLGVGSLAQTQPGVADALWNSLLVGALANLSGATWAAALLMTAAARTSGSRLISLALGLTWLFFVASAVLPIAGFAALAGAIAVAAFGVYQSGAAGLPFALMVIAAILRQHVGAEAAVGMLCVAVARADDLRRA